MLQLLPTLAIMFGLEMLLFYSFTIVGMMLWSGDIYAGNSKLDGTPFARDNYYANSFNNFVDGAMVCFELTVVNNWDGYYFFLTILLSHA